MWIKIPEGCLRDAVDDYSTFSTSLPHLVCIKPYKISWIFTLSVYQLVLVFLGVLRNQVPNDWRDYDALDFDFWLLMCGVVSL